MPEPCRRCGGSGIEVDWQAFGARIRAARNERGMGLREMARKVGCSPAFVSDLERGRRGGGLSGPKTQAILRELGLQTEEADDE
jgi:transcriptional regulator with XRE-family HTH domain